MRGVSHCTWLLDTIFVRHFIMSIQSYKGRNLEHIPAPRDWLLFSGVLCSHPLPPSPGCKPQPSDSGVQIFQYQTLTFNPASCLHEHTVFTRSTGGVLVPHVQSCCPETCFSNGQPGASAFPVSRSCSKERPMRSRPLCCSAVGCYGTSAWWEEAT
jgi:hypothetical protein